MVSITLKDITKTFGDVVAVDDVSIEIEDGELFTLLGPSGCGKTTLLRVVAGFYHPDNGQVFFDKNNVTDLPPHKRETGMVFQNYAIWPHMRVFDNVAFGLKIRKLPKSEIEKRVLDILEHVRLSGFEERTPFQLSGGQQQRVALARALVINPHVLLLDEPLSNLDAKLRLEMRHELKRIQQQFGTTTIYVTHDQEEALSISNRVAILNYGELMQLGNPREIYEEPQNLFVADFIGSSTFLPITVTERNGSEIKARTPWGLELRGHSPLEDYTFKKGEEAFAAIRPEDFKVRIPEGDYNTIAGEVISVVFTGRYNDVRANIGGSNLAQAEIDATQIIEAGDELKLFVLNKDTIILPAGDDPFTERVREIIAGAAAAD